MAADSTVRSGAGKGRLVGIDASLTTVCTAALAVGRSELRMGDDTPRTLFSRECIVEMLLSSVLESVGGGDSRAPDEVADGVLGPAELDALAGMIGGSGIFGRPAGGNYRMRRVGGTDIQISPTTASARATQGGTRRARQPVCSCL